MALKGSHRDFDPHPRGPPLNHGSDFSLQRRTGLRKKARVQFPQAKDARGEDTEDKTIEKIFKAVSGESFPGLMKHINPHMQNIYQLPGKTIKRIHTLTRKSEAVAQQSTENSLKVARKPAR